MSAYYLPAVLKHIITSGNCGAVERLVRRILPRWKIGREFDPEHLRAIWDMDGTRVCLLRDVLQWSLNNVLDLGWKDVSRIETVVNALARSTT